MQALVTLLVGLGLLVGGGAMLVHGASDLAERWGVSPTVVGLTVVGFGTSAPELVVNLMAVASGATELAFGNVLGSNIANLALVLGIAAVLMPMSIQSRLARREVPLLLLGTTMLAVVALDDILEKRTAVVDLSDAVVLLLLFFVFVYIIVLDFFRARRHEDPLLDLVTEFPMLPSRHSRFGWLIVVGGLVFLFIGGKLAIDGAIDVASMLGVPATIIGLFVVALGTSLPELVTTVIAALRREPDLALGNVVGSNLFNTLFVLPVSALIRPISTPDGGGGDIGMSWLLVAVLIPVFYWGRARLGRGVGALLVLAFLAYMALRIG